MSGSSWVMQLRPANLLRYIIASALFTNDSSVSFFLARVAPIAETRSLFVDMYENVVTAAASDKLIAAVSGNLLGPLVPVGHSPVPVQKINPVVHVI